MASKVSTQAFEKIYKKLNSKQREAVDAIEGPVMVVAGPGTGKTQILTLRIANILRKTDTAPENILAITFTESGVYSMRRRLVDIIGPEAYKVRISTFHGFANDVIKTYPESFPRIVGAATVTEIEQIKMIEEILDTGTFPKLRLWGDPYFYVRSILSQIRTLKRENITAADFAALVEKQKTEFEAIPDRYYESGRWQGQLKGVYQDEEKAIEKNRELATLFAAYESRLAKDRRYDYEDMILEVVRELSKKKDVLLRLQEEHQYVLADEHQDANAAQNKILELLSSFHDHPNLFIVGDEKQAIFRFQGASLDNFLYFRKLYPNALLINLEENYRSTQEILDAAHSLIGHNHVKDAALRTRLRSQHKKPGEQITLYPFSNESAELSFLVQDIETNINAGIRASDLAIIYRDNKDALRVVAALEKAKISYVLESDQNALSDVDMRKLIMLLRALADLSDARKLSELLFVDFFNIVPLDAYKLIHAAVKERVPLPSLLTSKPLLKKLSLEGEEKVTAFARMITYLSKKSHNLDLVDFFELLVRESGFLGHLLSLPASLEKLRKLDGFFGEVRALAESKRNATFADLIAYLDTLESYQVLVKTVGGFVAQEGVRLMTAHKSKGLEFEVVYILDVVDGHWGNKRGRSLFRLPIGTASHDENEDERRLFYVALTRAKREAKLLYSRIDRNGKERLPALFVEEIDKALLSIIDTEGLEKTSNQFPTATYSERTLLAPSLLDQSYLRSLFIEQGLSVTALNNYLECPWRFFFANLVRLPQIPSKHQRYGTAIHAALRTLFDTWMREGKFSKTVLLNAYRRELSTQFFTDHEYEEALTKGEQALSGYYAKYNKTWKYPTLTELNIAGVFVDLPQNEYTKTVLLKGTLDRVEEVRDGEYVVTDYKTGKPKTRNELEGKTKSASGNEKRQLVFYRILIDRHFRDKRMKAGVIDFIEPDPKGAYHREVFEVTDADTRELETIIQEKTLEILSFSFWDKGCGEKECEYCTLARLLTATKNPA